MSISFRTVISAVAFFSSISSFAAVQTYKTCTTEALSPGPGASFAKNKVGPFKVKVQFEDKDYFVKIEGEYGARTTKEIDELVPVKRSNAMDTDGKWIFNLEGNADTKAGGLDTRLALGDNVKSNGWISLQDGSKSSWEGKLTCE